MMPHIVNSCPLMKLDGGLSQQHCWPDSCQMDDIISHMKCIWQQQQCNSLKWLMHLHISVVSLVAIHFGHRGTMRNNYSHVAECSSESTSVYLRSVDNGILPATSSHHTYTPNVTHKSSGYTIKKYSFKHQVNIRLLVSKCLRHKDRTKTTPDQTVLAHIMDRCPSLQNLKSF